MLSKFSKENSHLCSCVKLDSEASAPSPRINEDLHVGLRESHSKHLLAAHHVNATIENYHLVERGMLNRGAHDL